MPLKYITPHTLDGGKARDWLDLNIDHNRTLRMKHVAALARDMANGEFHGLNGDAIRFNDQHVRWDPTLNCHIGQLIDGQHRLWAIVQSGATVDVTVCLDVPNGAFASIDSGTRRGFNDVLTFNGFKNANNMAGLTRKMYQWDQGARFITGTGAKLTNAEQYEYFTDHNDEITAATAFAVSARRQAALSPGLLGVAHVLFHRSNPVLADQFLESVVTGVGLSPESPAYVLRERFNRELRTMGGSRLTEPEQLYFIIRAWNAYRTGEVISKLQLPHGGLLPGNIPNPI